MIHHFRIVILTLLLISVTIIGCGDSPTGPSIARLVYVAMGASDAVGIGAIPPWQNGYVYKIRDGLEQIAHEVALYNLGKSGEEISYIESTELPAALSVQPDVVTIWAGPNDITHGKSVGAFEISLENVFKQLREQTSAVVVMANVPDITIVPRFLIDPDPDVNIIRVTEFNNAIARQTAAYNIPLVDLFAGGYSSDWSYISLDGYHPSNKGHAKIAELFLEIIHPYF